MYKIKVTQEMGRGLYTEKSLNEGSILFEAELLILNETDTIKVNETELKYYIFKFNEKQDCLVLGDGEIFNHSDHANVKYELVEVEGRFKMRFTTISIVPQGSQLFIDYNQDIKVKTQDYVNQKSLIA